MKAKAILLTLIMAVTISHASPLLQLKAGSFDPDSFTLEDLDPIFHNFLLASSDSRFQIIQFPAPIGVSDRDVLLAEGIEIIDYLPQYAYLVKVPHDLDKARLEAFLNVKIMPFHPAFKVEPVLLKQHDKNWTGRYIVRLFDSEPFDPVITEIRSLGGLVDEISDGKATHTLYCRFPGQSVAEWVKEIAALEAVYWIEPELKYELCNDDTQWVAQSGLYRFHGMPIYNHGIRGEGQIVAVYDTGCDADMCYFFDSAEGMPDWNLNLNQRKIVAYHDIHGTANWDGFAHGTHTAGTIAGDDFAHPLVHDTGDGIALGAKLIIQDAGVGGDLSIPSDQYATFEATQVQGARVHSNSWGSPGSGGRYNELTQQLDRFVFEHPNFLPVFAAGNEGPNGNTLRSPGAAKNSVCVGATKPGHEAENMAEFSSHGPSPDGRIKPDITLCGQNILSAADDGQAGTLNCNQREMSGTSMATPGVAGCLALLRQYFTDGFYPTGRANPSDSFFPSAALMKAVLINGAENMTGTSTADSGLGQQAIPSMGQGWGRVNLDNALFFEEDTRDLYIEDKFQGLSTGQVFDLNIGVITSSEPFEVTLVWSDAPAALQADPALVNDLDLEVRIGGDTYVGNNYSLGVSRAGGFPDRKNNVECILIPNPTPGKYRIKVKAANIPSGPQPFALAVTGDLGFPNGRIYFHRKKANCADTIDVTLTDYDLAGQGTYTLTVTSDTDTTGIDITLSEFIVGTGVFKGQLQTTTQTSQPGKLQVTAGDSVTIEYTDADDGLGGSNVLKSDTVTVDCTAPIIQSVTLGEVTQNSAEFTITTDTLTSVQINYGILPDINLTQTFTKLDTSHVVELSGLNEGTYYKCEVVVHDEAWNEDIADNNGQYYVFATRITAVAFQDDMTFDRGWTQTGDGQWERAKPQGKGGGFIGIGGKPDPSTDHTGNLNGKCWGTDLTGDGNYNPNTDCTLYSPVMNCDNVEGAILTFYHWLNSEPMFGDDGEAKFEVKDYSGTWNMLYSSKGTEMEKWEEMTYDVSQYADNNPMFQARFSLTSSGFLVGSSGWNIDDFAVIGLRPVTYTPPPTLTPTPGTPIPTETPTPTMGMMTQTPTPTETPDTPTGTPASPTPTETACPPPDVPVITHQGTCSRPSYTLHWSDESASGAEEYEAECATDGAFQDIVEQTGWIAETEYTFDGLSEGLTYYFRVRAGNSCGGESSWSETLELPDDRKAPAVLMAGYWDTRIQSGVGGQMTLIALLYAGEAEEVELTFQGQGTGVYLADDGQSSDFQAGDGIYGLTLNLDTTVQTAQILLGMEASDFCANKSNWPYLVVK